MWVNSVVSLTSARAVQTIKTAGYHRAGPGLYLQVTKSGAKSWLYRFKSPLTLKQREMGLGSLNFIGLAEARELAVEKKRLVLLGKDPIEERKEERKAAILERAKTISFEQAATECIEAKRAEWSNSKHAAQWTSTLETYAYPIVGSLSINEIETNHILRILSPIWTSKSETASRVRQRIETVWDFSKARGLVEGENPARLKGHLENLLPKTSRIKRVKHFPALPYIELSDFVLKLRTRPGASALALEFLILTAARTNEVIGAKWHEIDTTNWTWTVPLERMKTRRSHRVPLSDRAIKILKNIRTNADPDHYIFPGGKIHKPLSNNAMLSLVKNMNYGHITPHGFRSTFRDWAAEHAYQFSNETVELALAHAISNKTEAAYRRGDQLDRRRDLMQQWSNFISTSKTPQT